MWLSDSALSCLDTPPSLPRQAGPGSETADWTWGWLVLNNLRGAPGEGEGRMNEAHGAWPSRWGWVGGGGAVKEESEGVLESSHCR